MHRDARLWLSLVIALCTGCGATSRSRAALVAPRAETPTPEAPSPEVEARERPVIEGTSEITVRDIDWADRTYDLGAETYEVRDGECEWDRGEGSRGFFWVTEPIFGDLTGDGVEEAIILTTLNTGGTGMLSSALIFGMVDGRPELLDVIEGGDRGDGGLNDALIEEGALIVERLDSQPGDGACCPSQAVIETWRWTESGLIEDTAARRTELIPPSPR